MSLEFCVSPRLPESLLNSFPHAAWVALIRLSTSFAADAFDVSTLTSADTICSFRAEGSVYDYSPPPTRQRVPPTTTLKWTKATLSSVGNLFIWLTFKSWILSGQITYSPPPPQLLLPSPSPFLPNSHASLLCGLLFFTALVSSFLFLDHSLSISYLTLFQSLLPLLFVSFSFSNILIFRSLSAYF